MAQVITPERRRSKFDEILNTVMAGVSIADKVYGIKASQAASEASQASKAKAIADQEMTNQGIITQEKAADYVKSGMQMQLGQPFDGTDPGVGMKIRTPEGDKAVWFRNPPKVPEVKTRQVEVLDPKTGKRVIQIIEDKAGQTFEAAPPMATPAQIDAANYRDQSRKEQRDKELNVSIRNMVKDTDEHRSVLQTIEGIESVLNFDLEDYNPQTKTILRVQNGKIVSEPVQDLPGVSLPFFGRVAAGESAQRLKGKIDAVFNRELKTRSGATVTDQEMEKLRDEFGQGKYQTEEQMLEALKDYKALAIAAMRSHETSYGDETFQAYLAREGRGAITSEHFRSAVQRANLGQIGQSQSQQPPDGMVRMVNPKTGERVKVPRSVVEEAMKDGFQEVQGG